MTNSLPDAPLDVVIIGAGLTGLTAAFHLKEAGLSLHLLSNVIDLGGVIESHSEGGFIYESGLRRVSSVMLLSLASSQPSQISCAPLHLRPIAASSSRAWGSIQAKDRPSSPSPPHRSLG